MKRSTGQAHEAVAPVSPVEETTIGWSGCRGQRGQVTRWSELLVDEVLSLVGEHGRLVIRRPGPWQAPLSRCPVADGFEAAEVVDSAEADPVLVEGAEGRQPPGQGRGAGGAAGAGRGGPVVFGPDVEVVGVDVEGGIPRSALHWARSRRSEA